MLFLGCGVKIEVDGRFVFSGHVGNIHRFICRYRVVQVI